MNAGQGKPGRADAVLFCRAAVVDGSVSEEDRSVEFICSTEDIDGHGTIVRQNWKLERFLENPVVLYAHNQWDLPIGLASDVRVSDGKLRARVTFSTEDLNPEAERVWKNVQAKTVRGVSAGFLPHSVKWEKHDDREVLVLDENELFELSITPTPSNANALAQMRSMATAQQTPPPAPEVPAAQPPENLGKEKTMPNENDHDSGTTMTVARALALPIGSTEHDVLSRVTSLRELETETLAITGAATVREALGAIRANKEAADRLKGTEEKLAKVETERDAQNFDALVNQALAERKMTPAEATFKREGFASACAEGRGSMFVEELRGWVKVAAPRLAAARVQPEVRGANAEPLVWNGKPYGELKPAQRARLANEDPELFREMKADHEAAAAV